MNARPTEAAADSSDGPASKKPRPLTEGEIDAGYDLCREAANFTHEDNQIGRLVMKQKNDPNSPLFSWSYQSIGKAVKGVKSTREEASP
eukprot:4300461-Amphidinium_carterae.1